MQEAAWLKNDVKKNWKLQSAGEEKTCFCFYFEIQTSLILRGKVSASEEKAALALWVSFWTGDISELSCKCSSGSDPPSDWMSRTSLIRIRPGARMCVCVPVIMAADLGVKKEGVKRVSGNLVDANMLTATERPMCEPILRQNQLHSSGEWEPVKAHQVLLPWQQEAAALFTACFWASQSNCLHEPLAAPVSSGQRSLWYWKSLKSMKTLRRFCRIFFYGFSADFWRFILIGPQR